MPALKPETIGFKEVVDALQAIGKVVTQSADRKGLYAAAVLIRDEARRRVPVRTGSLKKAIVARTKRVPNPHGSGLVYQGQVAIDKLKFTPTTTKTGKATLKRERHKGGSLAGTIYPRNYAHLVEYGTRPHSTKPLSKPAKEGHLYPDHPGARMKPFLRPARVAAEGKAMEIYRKTVLAEIDKKAQQLATKARAKAGKK